MSSAGYEIYEPEILGTWLGTVTNRNFMVALLTWLIVRVKEKLGAGFPVVAIDLIAVNYLGCYPAIGIKSDDDTPENMSEILDVLVRDIFSQVSVLEFVDFVFANEVDWSIVADELLD